MKLESDTINILKSFSRINKVLILPVGNVVYTMTPSKTMLAKAILKEEFPQKFIITDLPKFLGAYSIFSEPELDFDGSILELKEGKRMITIKAGSELVAPQVPDRDIELPDPIYEFTIKADEYKTLINASSIVQAQEIVLHTKNGKAFLSAKNEAVDKDSGYSVELGPCDKSFNIIFVVTNFVMMAGDYDVSIHIKNDKAISKFVGESVTYWVPSEAKSRV